MTAFEQGQRAASAGRPAISNPYPVNTQDHDDWAEGWTDAQGI